MAYIAQTRAYKSELFIIFLNKIFVTLKNLNILKSLFILNNVPFYKAVSVITTITEAGHLIKYLHPYSPFLNPIENMFSAWKEFVRRERQTSEKTFNGAN